MSNPPDFAFLGFASSADDDVSDDSDDENVAAFFTGAGDGDGRTAMVSIPAPLETDRVSGVFAADDEELLGFGVSVSDKSVRMASSGTLLLLGSCFF